MVSFEFSTTFEDGRRAGDSLLALITEIQPARSKDCQQSLSPAELIALEEFVAEACRRWRGFPCVMGFLSRIIKPQEMESDIINLWGIEKFISRDLQFSLIPADFQIVQFGSWTGDFSDGDRWTLDLHDQCIRCLSVGTSTPETEPNYLRRSSYAVLPSLDYLASYLRCAAVRRGWIEAFHRT